MAKQRILQVRHALHSPNEIVCDFSYESTIFRETKDMASAAHSSLAKRIMCDFSCEFTLGKQRISQVQEAQHSTNELVCDFFCESTTFR